MNRILTFCIIFAFSAYVNAQNVISINSASNPESYFSPKKLIEDVFLFGTCSVVENFEAQTAGTASDLKNKNYGYFEKRNSNFPFKNGIIITNGNAYSGGNRYVSNGTDDDDPNRVSKINDQKGDKDLEKALNNNETYDASYFKFSFIPTKSTLSFRFILASEEYDGRKECLFADSFAFLLRKTKNGTYKNMATLPTGEPISVNTINDSEFCRSNPQYFEGYNVKQTNYDGRTKVLTAKANVTPGEEYEIKIVIADQGDYKWDSAIFLEGESFDFQTEVDLGEDVTIKKGNAPCQGENILLKTELPSNLKYVWKKNNVVIPGETSPNLSVTTTGEYTVNVAYGSYCRLDDTTLIEFTPKTDPDATDLFACNDGSGTAIFNLLDNKKAIFQALDPSLFNLSFYTSASDANTNTNPITTPTNYSGKDEQTIYYTTSYIGALQPCKTYGEFKLKVKDLTINSAPDLELCDDYSNDDIEAFNLEQQTNIILGDLAGSNITVSYHINATDANTGNNPLQSPYDNIVTPQPIYVRLQSQTDKTCLKASFTPTFKLIVKERDNPSFVITPECLGASITVTGKTGGVLEFNPKPNDGTSLTKISNAKWEITNANPEQAYNLTYTTNGECIGESTQSFKAYSLPKFNIGDRYILCNDSNGTQIDKNGLIIDTELSKDDYTFKWTFNGLNEIISSDSAFIPNEIGTYRVVVTNKVTSCESEAVTTIESSSPPIIKAEVDPEKFGKKHKVTVTAKNKGSISYFEYSLDGGEWVNNNFNNTTYTFKNIALGKHTITVRDTYGCGETSVEIMVFGYPPFFTPNNDSFNDRWQIAGIENFPKAQILIFDRYGKLITQINAMSNGWDGRYNGRLLPSSDYWFTVKYTDKGTPKTFNGHFALKY